MDKTASADEKPSGELPLLSISKSIEPSLHTVWEKLPAFWYKKQIKGKTS